MNILNILALLGGIAFFLYGMELMGDGLEKMAGGKLEKILEGLTSNRFAGLFLGIGVTAIIQSSSATTVMVIGFVNSGIMRLSQAINVIIGANLGTTVTAWILSMTQINGDGILMALLQPSNFAPVFAAVGIILTMFTKNKKYHDIASILIGFAILMTGMNTMSKAVEPLSTMPEFSELLLLFSNPLLGVLVGIVLTGIMQSSSASIGVLQALSATGTITVGAAIPLILGQNIGACGIVLISSIGAKTNAKRAAMIHLYYNIIGVAVFMIAFYLLNALIGFSFMTKSINSVQIAMFHTGFNIMEILLLFPFSKWLEKLAVKTVREHNKTENEFEMLDERFLQIPSVAVERCRNLTEKMAEITQSSIETALSLVAEYSNSRARLVASDEDMIDNYEDRLGDFLVKIAGNNLTNKDSETVTLLLQSIGDFERISDYALNISQSAQEMKEKNISLSDDALAEVKVLSDAITEIVDITVNSFCKRDAESAKNVESLEEVVDRLCREMRNRHIARLQQGECTIETGFVFSDLLTAIERVSDHCSNLAISVIQYDGDNKYAHEIKSEGKDHNEQYKEYKTKYMLPESK